MNIVKKIGMYVSVFLLTMCGLAAMLVLSARIPRTALQDHMRDSAEYLSRYDKCYRLIKGADSSRLDRNADAVWLSIAYGYDSKKPVSSVLWSKYYGRAGTESKDAFLLQTRQGLKGNQEYLRYWHGGNAFIRLFHLVTDIRGIYLFHGLLIGLILLGIMTVLYRNGMAEVGVSFCISLAFVGIWVVPFCLEYSFVILWALFMTCVMIGKCLKGEWEKLGILFMINGMVTVYLDFFTTETLALLLPLLTAMAVSCKKGLCWKKKDSRTALFYALLWAIGYAGMWISKWILAMVVLQTDPMPIVSGHAKQWLGNTVAQGATFPLPVLLVHSILQNLRYIFPCNIRGIGFLLAFLLLMGYIYHCFVYRKEGWNRSLIRIYFLLAGIPILRFLILHSHSVRHCFFTHRALAGTIYALLLLQSEITDRRWLLHGFKRGRN